MKPSFIQRAKTNESSTKSNPKTKQAKKSAKKTAKKTTKKVVKKTAGRVPPPSSRRRLKSKQKEEEDFEMLEEPGFFASLIKYTLILAVLSFGVIAYVQRVEWGLDKIFSAQGTAKHKPDPETYRALIDELASERQQLKELFLNANSQAEQEKILSHASFLLEEAMPRMMRCWLGHPYDFNGTASTPGGEGKIACGYFVSVVMRDAGFDINRFTVARQPSQNIIRTFVKSDDHLEIKVATPYPLYVEHLTNKYEGIQIIGLDTHVAFVVIKDGKLNYIHATAGSEQCVVDQDVDNASSLKASNYRVISNISRNPEVIRSWILNEKFPTAGVTANLQ